MTPQFDSLLDFLLVHQGALKYLIKIFDIKKNQLGTHLSSFVFKCLKRLNFGYLFSYRFLVNFYCKICLKIYNIKVDRHTWSFVKTFLKNTIFKALECFICLNFIDLIIFSVFSLNMSNQIWINQSDHHNVHKI